MATLTGPVTGGAKGWPFGAAAFDLKALGYVEEEYFLEGEAERYRHSPGTRRSFDGRWFVEPAGRAPYRTRILIRRPADPSRFNGTVVALWNNVSLGFDIFAGECPQIYRGGFAIALVSAQRIGVHGFPATPERALTGWDPARYGSLHIESDEYSYDIFTQAARLLGPKRSKTGIDPLQGLDVRKIAAVGASQSAVRLATYLNAVQPITHAFDGFFLHVYFGNGAQLEEPRLKDPPITRVEDIMPLALRMPPGSHLLRNDLDVPVLVMNSETESTLHYPVRQPDSDTYRFWEVAGVAHGCAAGSQWLKTSWPRDLGLDRHPMAPSGNGGGANNNVLTHEPVNSAALMQLHRWVNGGAPPPVLPRLSFTGDPPRLERDALGLAKGGIRLPALAAPRARHTGVDENGLLQMFGTSTPFSDEMLARLYPEPDRYGAQLRRAIEQAVEAGFLLPVDAEAMMLAS
jgi:hypothetical protein